MRHRPHLFLLSRFVFEVIRYGNFFGAVFCAVLALSILILRTRRIASYMAGLILLSGTFIIFSAFCNMSEIYFEPIFVNYLVVPFIFNLGPSTYLFFFATLDDRFSFDWRQSMVLAPGALLLLALPVVNLFAPEAFAYDVKGYFEGRDASWLDKLMLLGFLGNGIYYFLILRRGSSVFNYRALRSERVARLFLSIFFGVVILTSYAISSFITRNINTLYYAAFLTSIMAVLGFMFRQRFPEFFTDLEVVLESVRYKNTQIKDLDLKKLHLDLVDLMNTEKIYLKENLSVKVVAEELDIKPYQLSEFLNKHLQINFAQFVNNFRVEKAARMLLEDEKANILSVAYKVGFNSKATFNLAFQNSKGMSPREYVKKRRALRASLN